MKERLIALLLAVTMLVSLAACGGQTEEAEAPVAYSSLEELTAAAGFAVTLLPMEETDGYSTILEGGELKGYSLLNGTIAITEYAYQDTTVELRMSLTEADYPGLSGVENSQKAGGVQLDDDRFSSLDVYLLPGLYYCEFSYEAAEGERYYSLSRSDTDFQGYVEVLQVLIAALQAETAEAEANE